MKFIKLTTINGDHIWMNMDLIAEMYRRPEATVMYIGNSADKYFIKETPQEIIKLIREAE